LADKKTRDLGSIHTPADFAQFLTSWAIREPRDKVLDIGIGEGVFTFTAYRRLIELGATTDDACYQLYGAEIDNPIYNKFLQLAKDYDTNFPNLHNINFFDLDFPEIDTIIGNPPYVRRIYLEDVDRIRQIVINRNQFFNEFDLPRLTDLYVYFLLHAAAILKVGGRLAVITADSWLNVGYGQGLKKYLLQHFKIENLISLDRRVFNDAQVKPVLILATKKEEGLPTRYIHFTRLKNGLPVNTLQSSNQLNLQIPDLVSAKVNVSILEVDKPWGIYFKAPKLYDELASHALMIPIANLAQTRIGIQTLAKEFFVLTPKQVNSVQIEEEYLAPLAQSSRYFCEPSIEPNTEPTFYIFYCAKGKDELGGTHTLEYIQRAESAEVQVRGKNTTVIGYHSKERIKRSSRKYWYDLKTSLNRRGRAAILIPRLIYRTFTVVWNKANFVPGELFIEFLPPSSQEIDIEVYLAVLTSSITEIMLRAHAQVYGGGTYNINPGQIKQVPILNVNLLTSQQRKELKRTYLEYLADKNHNRSRIDAVVYRILELNEAKQRKLAEVLNDLLLIATSSKKTASSNP
jgi:hypothetical protein